MTQYNKQQLKDFIGLAFLGLATLGLTWLSLALQP